MLVFSSCKIIGMWQSKWLSGYFGKPSKTALAPDQWKSKGFEINLRVLCYFLRSQWVCLRSEVNFGACMTFWRHDEYAWGQMSGFCDRDQNVIEVILTHTCPRIDLWPRADLSLPHRWHHTQINVKPDLIFMTWIFALLTKIATRLVLTVTNQWFCTLVITCLSIYLNEKVDKSWQNISFLLICIHFSNSLPL